MRLAIVADVHVGNHTHAAGRSDAGINDRARECLSVLGRAVEVAHDHGCYAFAVLGDLFHSDRPSPQLVKAVQDVLAKAPNPIVLLGNHERRSAVSGDHALGPLTHVDCCRVFDQPGRFEQGINSVALVPYQSGPAEEWIESSIQQALCDGQQVQLLRPPVLLLHLGLRDKQLREHRWAREADDAVDVELLFELCHRYQISRVFAGNWHSSNSWSRQWDDGFECELTQVGALVPTGWNNPGLQGYGGICIVELDDGCVVDEDGLELPGPRFITPRSMKELKADIGKVKRSKDKRVLHVRMTAAATADNPDAVASLRVELGRYAKRHKDLIASWDVVPDARAASQAAQGAVAAARSSSTLRGAVDAYFDRAIVSEVSKEAVRARVYDLLRLE